MDEKIEFVSDGYRIEGLLAKQDNNTGVVVTHPHPLYGGDMYNSVVETIVRVYQRAGYTTLRFNFRGTGKSQGEFDNGNGESNDLKAALTYLNQLGYPCPDLAGYSFGTWINAKVAASGAEINRMLLVSPPVSFIDFAPVTALPKLKHVIFGEHDMYCKAQDLQRCLSIWNAAAQCDIIKGADHFFAGYLDDLRDMLAAALSDGI